MDFENPSSVDTGREQHIEQVKKLREEVNTAASVEDAINILKLHAENGDVPFSKDEDSENLKNLGGVELEGLVDDINRGRLEGIPDPVLRAKFKELTDKERI